MSVFAQYLLPFSSKIASKTPENRCFLQNVAIGGNKVTIKKPLITTRYTLIINALSVSVVEVTLILRKHILFF